MPGRRDNGRTGTPSWARAACLAAVNIIRDGGGTVIITEPAVGGGTGRTRAPAKIAPRYKTLITIICCLYAAAAAAADRLCTRRRYNMLMSCTRRSGSYGRRVWGGAGGGEARGH